MGRKQATNYIWLNMNHWITEAYQYLIDNFPGEY